MLALGRTEPTKVLQISAHQLVPTTENKNNHVNNTHFNGNKYHWRMQQ
jgi:hypothetical protein